jgi:ABC-type amino acid transport system permease subunit
MEFPSTTVTSVKANFATKRITIAFSMAINEGSMENADTLAQYTGKDAFGDALQLGLI